MLRTLTASPTLAGFLAGQNGAPHRIRASPDGKTIVSVTTDGTVRVWDATTRRPIAHQPPAVTRGLPDVAVNDAGLLAGGMTDSARLWNLKANSAWRWQPPKLATKATIDFPALALSNDGKLAVAHGYPSSTLDVWDVNTGRRIGAPTTLVGLAHRLVFSHDGTRLAISVVRPDNQTLALALFDASTLIPGVAVDAHHGFYDPLIFPFADEVLFSPDDHQVSSVASRGEVVTTVDTRATPSTESAIATFDAATGARLPAPTVAVGQELIAATPDLSVVAVKALHDVGIVDAVEVRTARGWPSCPCLAST